MAVEEEHWLEASSSSVTGPLSLNPPEATLLMEAHDWKPDSLPRAMEEERTE